MKTIFITLFQGTEARSILRTNIFKVLMAQSNLRVVFLVGSQDRAEYYKKEFNYPNTVYEVISKTKPKLLDKFFLNLSFKLLNTETVRLRRKMALEENRNYLVYFFNVVVGNVLARGWIRKLVRSLDYFLVRENYFTFYFKKYQPSVVFLAHLFDELEISLLKESKRRNIKTIGFINSWDKLTARNIIRVLPNKLLVFNSIVKQEAIKYADMAEKNIYIVGIPSYDWHINYKHLNREEFFINKKLDLSKKLVVYAPMGKTFSNSDWEVIDFIEDNIKSGQIKNSQLFVRFQPNDFVDELELKKRLWLRYDYPGIRFSGKRGVDWDMSFDDIKGLTDTLANTDIFICYASSMSIDAALFDKPVINIDYEVKDKELMSKSPTYFYKMAHYQNAVKSGGINYPKNKKNFINQINLYLNNPTLDKVGRQRLVNEQCWKVDGRASERIANFILESLN